MTPARFGALWLVLAGLVSGVAIIGVGHVRLGGLVVAGVVSVAALLRMMLSPRAAAGLVVRSRFADVAFLLVMAVALFAIVITLDLRPRP